MLYQHGFAEPRTVESVPEILQNSQQKTTENTIKAEAYCILQEASDVDRKLLSHGKTLTESSQAAVV